MLLVKKLLEAKDMSDDDIILELADVRIMETDLLGSQVALKEGLRSFAVIKSTLFTMNFMDVFMLSA